MAKPWSIWHRRTPRSRWRERVWMLDQVPARRHAAAMEAQYGGQWVALPEGTAPDGPVLKEA